MERLFSRINYKFVKGNDITHVFRNKVIKFMPDGFINILACKCAYKCDMCLWCYFFVLACIFIALLRQCFYMFDCWLPCHKQQNKTICCTYNWKNQKFFENKWAFCVEKQSLKTLIFPSFCFVLVFIDKRAEVSKEQEQ